MAAVAILGTGIMGAPIARHLLAARHDTRVWNRTRVKAEPLGVLGATLAASPADAVAGADVVLTMLADEHAVGETMEAASGTLTAGTLWLQMSTVGAAATDRFAAQAAER